MPQAPPDEEPLIRIALRRVIRRARAQATTPELGRFLLFHASGAAGDALLAIALAGSLFFSVPTAEARGRVALYLALTVAPFAVVTPFLSRFLDRHRGSLRLAIVIAALGRAGLAWTLASRLDSLYLFPIAFGILVLSRAATVVRGALLPRLVREEGSLVQANSSISKTGAVAGMAAILPGVALIRLSGDRAELLLAALTYLAGVIPAIRIPGGRGQRDITERLEARRALRARAMRQAVVMATGMRLLIGFLVFHLAFALRRESPGSAQLGLLIACAAAGTLLGAIVVPRFALRLREEGVLFATMAIAGLAALVAGQWFSVSAAAILVFVFGTVSGAAKLAFDALVQRNTSEAGRGWAFARFESILQLAWVLGGLVPVVVSIPAGGGVTGAGVLAVVLALLFVIGRRRSQASALP